MKWQRELTISNIVATLYMLKYSIELLPRLTTTQKLLYSHSRTNKNTLVETSKIASAICLKSVILTAWSESCKCDETFPHNLKVLQIRQLLQRAGHGWKRNVTSGLDCFHCCNWTEIGCPVQADVRVDDHISTSTISHHRSIWLSRCWFETCTMRQDNLRLYWSCLCTHVAAAFNLRTIKKQA